MPGLCWGQSPSMSQAGDQFYLSQNQSGQYQGSTFRWTNSALWGNFEGHMDIFMVTIVLNLKKKDRLWTVVPAQMCSCPARPTVWHDKWLMNDYSPTTIRRGLRPIRCWEPRCQNLFYIKPKQTIADQLCDDAEMNGSVANIVCNTGGLMIL